ncbi:MAG TPA: ABC transporter ATP-binding protein [Chthoniobacterales bacterium]|nr:ABC transporter ATP-binding protein [Chthoniobacterales bacterium]
MPGITLRNVQIGQGALNLQIEDREFVVLTGPVDCGSSAIVRLIAGLDEAREGDILLGERRINDVPAKDRDIAFVTHDYVPYPGMSVYENLALGLRRRKFAAAEIRKRIVAVAEILGLQEPLDRNPRANDEERQMIALARAMVLQPKVFLFDEPFSGLDSAARRRGRAQIKQLHQRLPATMIYATHDPVEALAIGERTVVLDRGRVQQDGSVQAVYDTPANLFVAGFAGSPPMNLIQGTLKQERDLLLFTEAGDGTIAIRLPISKDYSGKSIVLGIRPEDIEIAAAAGVAGRSPNGFKALVDRIEPRGPETDLYLKTGAHQLVCRSRQWIDQGEGGHRFQFEINPEKTHIFDPVSGRPIMAET